MTDTTDSNERLFRLLLKTKMFKAVYGMELSQKDNGWWHFSMSFEPTELGYKTLGDLLRKEIHDDRR